MNYQWREIVGNPSEMAEALGITLDWAMDQFSPLIVRRLCSDQDPWMEERMQRKIMKIIYVFDEPYDRCLSRADIDPLSLRRQKLCEQKTASNPGFSHWFPESIQSAYLICNVKKYREYYARTERLCAAPIYMCCRMLNFLEEERENE